MFGSLMSTKADVQQGVSGEQGEGEADVPGRQGGGEDEAGVHDPVQGGPQ